MRKWVLFALLSLGIFWLAFGPIGRLLSDVWSLCFTWLHLPGVFGAMWNVATTLLGILPQILIMFSYFYFLENSGLKFPSHLIMGFGCTTVAVCTTKSRRDLFTLPFIPCSAKAPVVLMVGAVLRLNFLVVFLLYVFCVCVGLVVGRFVKSPKVAKAEVGVQKGVGFFKFVFGGAFQFFKRISGTVLIAAAVMYFLSNYNFYLRHVEFGSSMLYWICGVFSPVFAPIGLGSPAVIAALAFGILGKELVAATLAVFAPTSLILSSAAPFGFTTASLVSFVVFFMLYPSCICSIKATAAQTNGKVAAFSVLLNFVVAYSMAFIVYILLCTVL